MNPDPAAIMFYVQARTRTVKLKIGRYLYIDKKKNTSFLLKDPMDTGPFFSEGITGYGSKIIIHESKTSPLVSNILIYHDYIQILLVIKF